jgi:hypothetical protein
MNNQPDHTASADRLLMAMCLMVAVTIITSIICL